MTILETRYGQLEVPDVEHDLIGRFLARYGEWANDEVRFVAAALPKEKPLRIFDVGAFVGTFGIGLSQIANVESTTFVEANPLLAPLLSRNAASNARGNSTVIEAAITPGGDSLVGSYDAQNLGSLSFSGDDASMRVQTETPARFLRLSDLVAQVGRVDLIKMDVEGLEHDILAADSSLLAPGGPAFWLECNDSRSSLELLDLLVKNGLNVYYFAFPSFAPDNFLGVSDPIFPWAYEAGLLASRDLVPTLPPVLVEHECILKLVLTRDELRHVMWQTPRWAPVDWKNASRAELVAEAAHAALGERFTKYLVDSQVVLNVGDQMIDVVAELKALRNSQARALSEARALRGLLEDAERRLDASDAVAQANADLKALASEAMRQLEEANAELKALTSEGEALSSEAMQQIQQIQQLEVDVAQRAEKLHQIERSPYWRISKPLRVFLGRHERLRNALRRAASSVYRLVR